MYDYYLIRYSNLSPEIQESVDEQISINIYRKGNYVWIKKANLSIKRMYRKPESFIWISEERLKNLLIEIYLGE